MMNQKDYEEVKQWMYRNARNVELNLWKYFFEQGKKEDVIEALRYYQNEDGGFGHALEADNWNPNSTPITTEHAIKILDMIEFYDMDHPIYQGILRYLESEENLRDYGWCFTVPDNDAYPHAPWWDYSEENNKKEYYGVTAGLSAFILRFGDSATLIYKKAEKFRHELFLQFLCTDEFGDMGISGLITLYETMKKNPDNETDLNRINQLLSERVSKSIEHDTSKWEQYVVRPSQYIPSPNSPFYEENKEIVQIELKYLLERRPKDSVWGITWTWFNHMEQYGAQFAVSENWWKGFRVIEKMLFLKNFGLV